jgi:hypothetical protein
MSTVKHTTKEVTEFSARAEKALTKTYTHKTTQIMLYTIQNAV